MRLVLTRPAEDAARSASALQRLGHSVAFEPLLTIAPLPATLPPLERYAALLLTSANGVRALCRALPPGPLPSCPVFAVGDQTAQVLREAGFPTVLSADGDVNALAALVAATLSPENATTATLSGKKGRGASLLHVAASDRAGDLAGLLAAQGFCVDRAVLYRAETATAFSPAFRAGLKAGAYDGILFYSPRTAATFARLMVADDGAAHLRVVTAFCLSHTVAMALESLPFQAVRVARHPRQDALLALLDQTA